MKLLLSTSLIFTVLDHQDLPRVLRIVAPATAADIPHPSGLSWSAKESTQQMTPQMEATRQKILQALLKNLDKKLESGYFNNPVESSVLGLVLLSQDASFSRGPQKDNLKRIFESIQEDFQRELPEGAYSLKVWSLAYSVLFLSELSKTASAEDRARIDTELMQRMNELALCQNPQNGGWGHHPKRIPTPNGHYSDFAVISALCLAAFLRAEDNGYSVDPEISKKGFDYLEAVIQPNGAPKYNPSQNVGVGEDTEGAPRGAMVMWPFSLEGKKGRDRRALYSYLKKCKSYAGGHGHCALGLAHASLMFAQNGDYGHLWKLHGKWLEENQLPDGRIRPLPAGARMPTQDSDDDLLQIFYALTLSAPQMPWIKKDSPAASEHPLAMVQNASALKDNDSEIAIKDISELTDLDRTSLTSKINKIFDACALRNMKTKKWPDSIGKILNVYIRNDRSFPSQSKDKINLSIAPIALSGISLKLQLVDANLKAIGSPQVVTLKSSTWSRISLIRPSKMKGQSLQITGSFKNLSFPVKIPENFFDE
ncbi:MAG: hypothetical protein RL095_3041 [Verrucomicrobiota bacterium]|jgi:hypothetical protein